MDRKSQKRLVAEFKARKRSMTDEEMQASRHITSTRGVTVWSNSNPTAKSHKTIWHDFPAELKLFIDQGLAGETIRSILSCASFNEEAFLFMKPHIINKCQTDLRHCAMSQNFQWRAYMIELKRLNGNQDWKGMVWKSDCKSTCVENDGQQQCSDCEEAFRRWFLATHIAQRSARAGGEYERWEYQPRKHQREYINEFEIQLD